MCEKGKFLIFLTLTSDLLSPDLRQWKIYFFEKCSYDHETQNNAKISDFLDVKISHLLNMERRGTHIWSLKSGSSSESMVFWQFIIGILKNLNAKLQKRYWTVFEKLTILCEKGTFLIFLTLTSDLLSPDLRQWKIHFFEKCSYDHETQNNAKISDFWDIKISHLLNMEGVGYTFLGP